MSSIVQQMTGHRILEDVSQAQHDNARARLEAELAALRAENQRLKAKAAQMVTNGLTLRVSAKGAVSVYGMGRFPVTLYAEQWQRLAAEAQTIGEFIEEHKAELKFKAEE